MTYNYNPAEDLADELDLDSDDTLAAGWYEATSTHIKVYKSLPNKPDTTMVKIFFDLEGNYTLPMTFFLPKGRQSKEKTHLIATLTLLMGSRPQKLISGELISGPWHVEVNHKTGQDGTVWCNIVSVESVDYSEADQ